jgi:hypothetical protein
MSTGTSLVALKQALITALRARAGLVGVQVLYAAGDFQTGDDHLEGEAIWLRNTEWESSEFPVMRAGTKKVDEVYALEVFVQVLKTDGSSQETADLRALALVAELQQALAETPQVSAQTFWGELKMRRHITGQLSPGPGHGSRFEAVIWVKARLAP